jgi:hypothetical protein
MASTYSTNLGIELIATGDQSGTWGQSTNNNFTNVFEDAIVGRAGVVFADADVIITALSANTNQTYRYLYLNCTGTNGAVRNLIVPTINKTYVVENNTTNGYSITVKTASGTGISVPNGYKVSLYVDGTNVTQAATHIPSINIGTATIGTPLAVSSGGTGVATLTGLAKGNGTGAFTAAVSGTDYAPATSGSSVLSGNGSGGFSNVTVGTGLSFSAGTLASTVNGTVTSVAVSGGTTGLTTSGGPITSSGTITLAGTLVVANGGTGVTTSTGSGSVVLSTSPTLVTPALGTPASATLTNATGLPLTTGVTGTLPVANGGTGITNNPNVLGIEFIIDGGGVTITTGIKGYLEVPFACTISQWTLLADQSGSITVDVLSDTYANYGTNTSMVGAGTKPAIASATKAQSAPASWTTTSITAGNIIGFNVTSATTVTRVTISLKVTRT